DYFSVIATIAGISTTLGFGVISVAYAVNSLFGIPDTMSLKFAIVVLMVVVFVSSSYIGIKKGMNRLSQFSIYAGLFTMVFLFIFGPTSFLLDSLVMSVGTYLDNFFYLHTWTDPIGQSGWLNTWTIFYCGWWIAWVPFTGGFIAKISKGRTIKEFILGVMILPSALTMVWFCTLGSSAVYAQITDKVDIYSSLMENSASGIYLLLSSYPFGSAMCIIVMITMMTFIITSTDASAFYCATIISKGVLEPSRQIKVICGIIIGLTAFFLLTTGGLQALQTMAIVGAFPFSIILLLLIFSVRNMLATAWQEREMAIESKKVA
ncbi:MAG: BCCT family transporter, partial [Clostridiales bacterium]